MKNKIAASVAVLWVLTCMWGFAYLHHMMEWNLFSSTWFGFALFVTEIAIIMYGVFYFVFNTKP